VSPRRPPAPGKRAQLRAQQRRRRRRIAASVVAGVTALALLVVVIVISTGGGGGTKHKGPTRTQHTLLLQVQQPDRTALSSALLAHDSKTKLGSVVLVPPQVLAQVPGVGSLPFGRALALGEANAAVAGARNALADLLGVTVDGSWILDVATFQRLIDQEGGVQVTVDVPVLRGRTVLLNPGAQRLDGGQAQLFASYLASGEQEQSRLARLQGVLDGVVSGLPSKPDTLIRSLGAGSRSSMPVGTLSSLLTGLKQDDSHEDLQYRSLPVIPIASGDEAQFRIDAPAVKALVSELLAPSVPPGIRAEGNRVLVLNGVGTPGLGAQVREKLVTAGFVFVGSRNADHFGYPKTQVLVKEATTEAAALGARVARALGVPSSSVSTSNQIGSIADVVVIVGQDFRHK
jgi:hypothetical protein